MSGCSKTERECENLNTWSAVCLILVWCSCLGEAFSVPIKGKRYYSLFFLTQIHQTWTHRPLLFFFEEHITEYIFSRHTMYTPYTFMLHSGCSGPLNLEKNKEIGIWKSQVVCMFTASSCLSLVKNMKYTQRCQNMKATHQQLAPGPDKPDSRESNSSLILKISKVLAVSNTS